MKKKLPHQSMGIVGIGIGLILVGFAVVVIGILMQSLSADKPSKDTSTKFSFVGFIGPIPFGFGNDKQWVMTGLVIAIALFILMMWIFRGVR